MRPHIGYLGILTVVGLSLTPHLAAAAWQPNGVPVCAHAKTQFGPIIEPDGAGGAYIMWTDERTGGVTGYDEYLQHVTSTGDLAAGWPADGVPLCAAPENQFFGYGSLVTDGAGGVLAAWWDRRNGTEDDVYAVRMTAAGAPAPSWPVNGVQLTSVYGAERQVNLAPDGSGGAYVVWEDGRDSISYNIYGMHVLGDGTRAPGWPENGLPICTLAGSQFLPRPIPDGAGGVLIVWSGPEIRAIRLNTAGERAPGWAENGNIVCAAQKSGGGARPVPDGAGGMFVVWVDMRTLPPGVPYPQDYQDIYAQHVRADGTLAPGWPVDGLPLCTAPFEQGNHQIAADGMGGVLMAWGDYRNRFTEAEDVYAIRVGDGALAPGWTANGVRVSNEPGYQLAPVGVAPDGQGGMYVVYDDFPDGYYKLAAQHLTGTGALAPGWPPNGRRLVDNGGDQMDQVVIPDGAGGAIVAWTDYRGAADGSTDIYAQHIGADGPTPVLLSLVSAEAEPDHVRITWLVADRASLRASVERRTEATAWEAIGPVTADGQGWLTYEDRAVVPGSRYAYRLSYADGEGAAYTSEAWVTVPELRFALRGLTPNPSAGDPIVAFSLATPGPASLEVYDLGGRRVLSRDVGSLGPGAHSLRLDQDARLPAGVYTVRLRQGMQSAIKRAVVVR